MVFISSKKYACETCIKGHRSSACKHTDRPLFEIKKKGRPVTQCEHCRELRKTKQVHVKCICEVKVDPIGPTHKQCNNKAQESAAFPNGLPEALEASVALHVRQASDSDVGGVRNSCTCQSGGACHCCTPRKTAARSKRNASLDAQLDGNTPSQHPSVPHNQLYRPSPHILARIAELRPVLPRPPSVDPTTNGPIHQASAGSAHGHPNRHHDFNFYSPYGRAYDRVHQPHSVPSDYEAFGPSLDTSASSYILEGQPSPDRFQMLDTGEMQWFPPSTDVTNGTNSFPSVCGCGSSCRCPGCIQHKAAGSMYSPSAFSTCVNPGACTTCLDCTILSMPASLPEDTALSIQDSYQVNSIDEWIRQVSIIPNSAVSQTSLGYGVPIGDESQQWDAMFSGNDMNALAYATSGERASCSTEEQQSMYTTGILSRSRSPSTSSQSSHGPTERVYNSRHGPVGRVEGFFNNPMGVRSAPQLNIPSILRLADTYPSSPASGSSYAVSNPDTSRSVEDLRSQYDSSMDQLRIY